MQFNKYAFGKYRQYVRECLQQKRQIETFSDFKIKLEMMERLEQSKERFKKKNGK
jgi:hypothetical protein